jgi:hypothetical protein
MSKPGEMRGYYYSLETLNNIIIAYYSSVCLSLTIETHIIHVRASTPTPPIPQTTTQQTGGRGDRAGLSLDAAGRPSRRCRQATSLSPPLLPAPSPPRRLLHRPILAPSCCRCRCRCRCWCGLPPASKKNRTEGPPRVAVAVAAAARTTAASAPRPALVPPPSRHLKRRSPHVHHGGTPQHGWQ